MVFTRKFSQFIPAMLQEAVGLAGGANSIGPTSGGASITYTFTQSTVVAPALYLGAAVRVDVATGLWECCLGTTPLLAEFYGFIVAIAGDVYTVQFAGPVPAGVAPLLGLVPGTPYYLSDTVAGGISAIPPAVTGEVNLPVLWAMDNGNSVIRMSRGFIEGGGSGGGGGGGMPPNNVVNITQTVSFALGDVLYLASDMTFAKANARSLAASQAEWMVTNIITPGSAYTIQQGGQVKGLVLTDDVGAAIVSGPIYYVSPIPTQEGKLTRNKPIGPNQFSKPFYVQQVLSSNTGWLLDQISQPASASPNVFLGYLNQANNWSDANILNNGGGPFGSYLMIFNANIVNGHGLSATGPNPIAIGFQFATGGVFYTGNNYQATLSGANNTTGIHTGTTWAYVDDTSSAINSMLVFPNIPGETGTRVAISFGSWTIINNQNNGGFALIGTCYCTDWSVGNSPANHNFSSTGYCAGGDGSGLTPSGIKLLFNGVGATVFDGTTGYFSIWGIPNS